MEKEKKPSCVTENTVDVGGKTYLVKSVFIGDKDIQTTILKLAEKKAARAMGIG